MAKKQAKAVRKIEKAVRKAVKKGVTEGAVEKAVSQGMAKGAKKKPVGKAAAAQAPVKRPRRYPRFPFARRAACRGISVGAVRLRPGKNFPPRNLFLSSHTLRACSFCHPPSSPCAVLVRYV